MSATLISNNTTIKFNAAVVTTGVTGVFGAAGLVYTVPANSYTEVQITVKLNGAGSSGPGYAFVSNDGGATQYRVSEKYSSPSTPAEFVIPNRVLIPAGYSLYAASDSGTSSTRLDIVGVNFINTP